MIVFSTITIFYVLTINLILIEWTTSIICGISWFVNCVMGKRDTAVFSPENGLHIHLQGSTSNLSNKVYLHIPNDFNWEVNMVIITFLHTCKLLILFCVFVNGTLGYPTQYCRLRLICNTDEQTATTNIYQTSVR